MSPLLQRKDFVGGALTMLLGLGTIVQATDYEIGTLRHMGPGFFPLALGIILAVTGMMITAGSFRSAEAVAGATVKPEWRGWICICAGVAAFVILGRYGGVLPATFAVVQISALGDRDNSPLVALALAAAMTLICLLVFWWLLRVQLPLFRWG